MGAVRQLKDHKNINSDVPWVPATYVEATKALAKEIRGE
jgi:hypothetical protein